MLRPAALVALLSILLISTVLPQEQPTLAILDFEASGVSAIEATAISDRLRTYLVQAARYQVVERGQMLEILKEQDFQLTGCVTTECAVEIGQLVGARYILLGSVAKIGNLFTMNARIADIETGSIVNTAAHDHTGDIGDLLSAGIQELSILISGTAPAPALPSGAYQRYSSTGRLNITSNIDSVNFVLSGDIPKLTGTLPFDLDQLPPGQYNLLLSRDGFVDHKQTIEIISMKTTHVFTPLLKPLLPLYKISSVGRPKPEMVQQMADSTKYNAAGKKINAAMVSVAGSVIAFPISFGIESDALGIVSGIVLVTGFVSAYNFANTSAEYSKLVDAPSPENIAYNQYLRDLLAVKNAPLVAQNVELVQHNTSLPQPSIVIE